MAQAYTPYDIDGNPQLPIITTYFMGGAYEVTDGAVKKYYAIAGMTVAVQDGNGLQYLLTDHLGSIVAVTDASGTLTSQQRYLPFGEVRTDVGSIAETDLAFTGQRSLDAQGHATIGLLDYHARFYDAYITHFSQPDSIIPDLTNPQALNRYAYALDNPIRYNDPTGYSVDCGIGDPYCSAGQYTPGGLIQLYDLYHKANTAEGTKELNQDIDAYMKKHSDYNSSNDIYLGFSIGDNRDLKFKNLRLQYWQERLEEAGVCKSQYFCADQSEQLYNYYDLHQYVRGPEAWDASRVSWPSVALDIAGIPLSLVGLGPLKPTTQVGARILFWTGIVDSGASVATANDPTKRLFAIGGAVPVAGAFFNFTLAIWDLDEGTYNLPYTPPISR